MDYIERINMLNNEYRTAVAKANQVQAEYGRHTVREGAYIEQALKYLQEMANISVGAEREVYQRRIQEMNMRHREISRALSPTSGKPSAGASAPTDKKSDGDSRTNDTIKVGEDGQVDVSAFIKTDKIPAFKEGETDLFYDVNGMQTVKTKLEQYLNEFNIAELKQYLGIKPNKSFIFIGPPGCGKTYIIERFVRALKKQKPDCEWMVVQSADILSKYVGDAEKIVKAVFVKAVELANEHPVVLFIDEFDGICKNRSMPNLPEYASSITTQFLEGYNALLKSAHPIYFIGATNYPGNIDRAMLDRVDIIETGYPDYGARYEKFKHYVKTISLTDGFTFEDMAALTETPERPYNYRDMERVCEELKYVVLRKVQEKYSDQHDAITALQNGEVGISREVFMEALKAAPAQDRSDVDKAIEQFLNSSDTNAASEKTPERTPGSSAMERVCEELRSIAEALKAASARDGK